MTPAFPRVTGQSLHDPGLSQGHGTVSTWPRPFPGSRDSLYMTPAFPRVTGQSLHDPGLSQGHGTVSTWPRPFPGSRDSLSLQWSSECESTENSLVYLTHECLDVALAGFPHHALTQTLSFCLYHCVHSPCLSFQWRLDGALASFPHHALTQTPSFCLYHCVHSPCLSFQWP